MNNTLNFSDPHYRTTLTMRWTNKTQPISPIVDNDSSLGKRSFLANDASNFMHKMNVIVESLITQQVKMNHLPRKV